MKNITFKEKYDKNMTNTKNMTKYDKYDRVAALTKVEHATF